ncbi:MAG: 50S ribosomal protein L10 [Clostridiales bacterium]|nr:50S ribosomal protein L10 [Clostridiales bacterium]
MGAAIAALFIGLTVDRFLRACYNTSAIENAAIDSGCDAHKAQGPPAEAQRTGVFPPLRSYARGLFHASTRDEEEVYQLSKNFELKKAAVADIRDRMQKAQSMVIIDYRGLTVAEVTGLRNQFRAQGVEYQVLKNTMVELAANDLGIQGLEPYLHGPTAVAFGMQDAVAPAKIIVDFIKKSKKTEIKCGLVQGHVIDVAGVQALAELPPKEVLIAKMMGSLNAPITNFVGVLSATLRSLVYAIDAVRKQKAGE